MYQPQFAKGSPLRGGVAAVLSRQLSGRRLRYWIARTGRPGSAGCNPARGHRPILANGT